MKIRERLYLCSGKTRAGWHHPLCLLILCMLLSGLALAGSGCDKGSTGQAGSAGIPGLAPIESSLGENDNLPGLNIVINKLSGGTGPNGNFMPGDFVTVNFTIKTNAGQTVALGLLDFGGIMISGPTTNYQRVIAEQMDLRTAALLTVDGSYSYTFTTAIPTTYIAPLNDTTSFGSGDGEITGQTLQDGTYTVGIEAYRNYAVGSKLIRDAANATFDFLIGKSVTALDSREVVKLDNCNKCHIRVQAHGGIRRLTKLCVLCHTSGSEDRNVSTVEGGTPGVSIDFRVMIHKIHNGAHLPSVLGVDTKTDGGGGRNYSATPKPYKIVGFNNTVHDFSKVNFPVWPNMNYPMPKDIGYSSLLASQKTQEDSIRTGVADCDACHKGATQESNAYTMLSRRACGSCHDDIRWDQPYTANGQSMPAQSKDFSCLPCHPETGGQLAVKDAHKHPFKDSTVNPGLKFAITALTGGSGTASQFKAGDKMTITLTIKNDAGTNLDPATINSGPFIVINGPTNNKNLLLYTAIPTNFFSGAASSHTLKVPMRKKLQFLGTATGGADVFTTSFTPIYTQSSVTAVVYEVTGVGNTYTTTGASTIGQNYLDLSGITGFADNDYVRIDTGGNVEYKQIQWVQGNRIWFTSPYTTSASDSYPGLEKAHSSGVNVTEVTLTTKTVSTQYSISNAATGQVTLVAGQFTNTNAVLINYATDFVFPSTYNSALNESNNFSDTFGKWTGKSIESGTYRIGVWGYITRTVTLYAETNDYRGTSSPAIKDFLVGTATTTDANNIVSAGSNCESCHQEVLFHGGGRRGYDTCLLCHGTSGSEDLATYTSKDTSKATPTTTVEFRQMLHKIHMGKELSNAATYTIIGFGNTAHTYQDVGFPAMPDGVKNCGKCHGSTSNAWKEPAVRGHSTSQTAPIKTWRIVCNSCHDSDSATAHMDINTTTGGAESCGVCHGSGHERGVDNVHKTR